MKDIGYTTLSTVLETWDQARFSSKDFESEFGMVALERLFELQPRAKNVFGYNEGDDKGKHHADIHAKAFAGLFDSVFQMMGPDTDFIQDILKGVGLRHKKMDVSPSFFPYMGQALIFAVEKFLERKLEDDEREAWEEVYEAISNEIVKAILND